jgi:hypothetical protein
MNGPGPNKKRSSELATLVANYLRQEEALLTAALPIVRALQCAFTQPGKTSVTPQLDRQQEFFKLMGEMHVQRQCFRRDLAQHLQIDPSSVNLEKALAGLPGPVRADYGGAVERVRQLAQDMAAANYEISVHLRIHLGAYRRILRDLTNTSAGSGRYGPAGTTESLDYRPLLTIHG